MPSERDGLNAPKCFLGELALSKLSMKIPAGRPCVFKAAMEAAGLSSRGPGLACALLVGDAVDHLDYGGYVMFPEAILDAAFIEADGHVEQRCRGSRLAGHVTDIIEIVREHLERALRRQEVLLNHAGCTDREQHRTATAAGNRLDHNVGIDSGFQAERDRLADGSGVDGNQQIVDELYLAGRSEGAGIQAHI